MSITDELREWAHEHLYKSGIRSGLPAIADRIDAEHEMACAEAWDNGYESDYLGIEKWLAEHPQAMEHHDWIRLPKDADGEPIHVGDVMEWCDSGDTLEVIGIGDDTLFYVDPEGDRTYAEWTAARNKRHYHKPTVEDVLREMLDAWGELPSTATNEAIVAEYAKRLTLVEMEDA